MTWRITIEYEKSKGWKATCSAQADGTPELVYAAYSTEDKIRRWLTSFNYTDEQIEDFFHVARGIP